MAQINLTIEDESGLEKIAVLLANYVKRDALILLNGDLGAGKTTFVRYYLKALGYVGKVTSPTFNIVKTYEINQLFYNHIDAYRLEDKNEDIGLDELIESEDVTLIEWPIYLDKSLLIRPHLTIDIHILEGNKRTLTFSSAENIFSLFFFALEELIHVKQ